MSNDWIRDVFEALISEEDDIINMVPSEKRDGASGRSAALLIDWEGQHDWHVKTYSFWFTAEHGVQWKPKEVELRNEIYMSEKTFYALTRGWIEPESARMHGDIKIAGDNSFYDGLEFQHIWKQIKDKLLKPIVDKAVGAVKEEGGAA
jgi:putative sterol carrier protein